MGSISDRALTLANAVAEAVHKKYPGKYVGMYAYSAHSPPPNLRVHPQVVISVATAFIRGGYTVDELMEGWHQKGATLGVREYFSVNTWDRDLPGQSRGSNLEYIREKIPHFHDRGRDSSVPSPATTGDRTAWVIISPPACSGKRTKRNKRMPSWKIFSTSALVPPNSRWANFTV